MWTLPPVHRSPLTYVCCREELAGRHCQLEELRTPEFSTLSLIPDTVRTEYPAANGESAK